MNSDDDKRGVFAGVPYDWRKPTVARAKSRWWNADDPRILTPKAFGWGWDVNVYHFVHPIRRIRREPSL